MSVHFSVSNDELLSFVHMRQLASGEKQEVDISTDETGKHVICLSCGRKGDGLTGYQTAATAKKIAFDILCGRCLLQDFEYSDCAEVMLRRQIASKEHYTDENLDRFVPTTRFRHMLRGLVQFSEKEFQQMEKALLARGAKIEELKIDEFARANKVRFPGNEIRLCRGVSYHPVLLAQKVMHCVTNKIGTYFPTAVLESKLVMDLQITDPIFKFANHYISYCNRIDPVKELPKITSEDDLNKLADSADYIPNHKFLLMFSKLIHEGKFELARGVLTFVQRALPKRNLSETILKHARIDCFMDKEDLLILLALASDELLDRFADRIKTVTLKHSCDFTGLEFVKALCRGKFDEYKEEFTLEFGKRSFVVSLSELLEAAHVVVAELRNIFEVGAGS